MSDFGLFEVATYSPSEGQLRKEAARDKLAAAIYDVREKFGSYLFQADSPQGFDDRAKLSYTDICKTIEPHLHARTGVYSRVVKELKKEWKQAAVSEDTYAQREDASVAGRQAGPKGIKPPAPVPVHLRGPQLEGRRTACYPGCHEDEAHSKKFHKKDADDEKEASRRQAGPPVHQDPQRAHEVLDHTHNKVDEHAQKQHQTLDHAHELVDQRSPQMPMGTEGLLGAPEGPRGPVGGFGGPDPYGDPMGGYAVPDSSDHPRHQLPDWEQQGMSAQDWNSADRPRWETNNPHLSSRHYADDGAYAEHAPDHPEMHNSETYKPSLYEPLKPEGDFQGYKDSVDQGAPSKVDHDFTAPDPSGTSPATVVHHDDNGDHNFVPKVTGSRTFQALSRLIEAEVPTGAMPPDAGMSAGMGSGTPGVGGQPMSSMSAMPATDTSSTPAMSGSGASTVQANRSYYSQLSAMLRQSAPPLGAPTPAAPPPTPGAPGGAGDIKLPGLPSPGGGHQEPSPASSPPSGWSYPGQGLGGSPSVQGPNPWVGMPGFGHEGHKKSSQWALKQIQEVGTKEARKRLLSVARSHGVLDDKTFAKISNMLTRKVADSNYLQKADEALTKVLNEKAEEFQNTIAPLQQALITIQQAEQLANPLNVSPPAGTVNVLPGQQGAGGAPMDASGGGVGMGAQPAAAGLAGQPATQALQQTARRKRGGQGKGRRLS